MGYDLHITRATDWNENSGLEISAEEWLALVDADPELGSYPAEGPYVAHWSTPEFPKSSWFDWYEGNVFTTDPEQPAVVKMLALAKRLAAVVQGDDGELYESSHEWRPRG